MAADPCGAVAAPSVLEHVDSHRQQTAASRGSRVADRRRHAGTAACTAAACEQAAVAVRDDGADARGRRRDGVDVLDPRRRWPDELHRRRTVRSVGHGDGSGRVRRPRRTTPRDGPGTARVPQTPVPAAHPGQARRRTAAESAVVPASGSDAAVDVGGELPPLGASPKRHRLRDRPCRHRSATAGHDSRPTGHCSAGGTGAAVRRCIAPFHHDVLVCSWTACRNGTTWFCEGVRRWRPGPRP